MLDLTVKVLQVQQLNVTTALVTPILSGLTPAVSIALPGAAADIIDCKSEE